LQISLFFCNFFVQKKCNKPRSFLSCLALMGHY
jgi:hypothetical protein